MEQAKNQEGRMDMQAMMALYRKLAEPGAPHQSLDGLTGTWTVSNKVWMEPGSPPVEGSGTCEQTMILGGRYLLQEYSFTDAKTGETGNALNLVAFDNHTGKYVSAWLDSMSTGIYYFEGTGSADGRIISQECRYDDPVKGPCSWRSVATIKDDDTLEYETYLTPEGGREEKMSIMTLTRNDDPRPDRVSRRSHDAAAKKEWKFQEGGRQ